MLLMIGTLDQDGNENKDLSLMSHKPVPARVAGIYRVTWPRFWAPLGISLLEYSMSIFQFDYLSTELPKIDSVVYIECLFDEMC